MGVKAAKGSLLREPNWGRIGWTGGSLFVWLIGQPAGDGRGRMVSMDAREGDERGLRRSEERRGVDSRANAASGHFCTQLVPCTACCRGGGEGRRVASTTWGPPGERRLSYFDTLWDVKVLKLGDARFTFPKFYSFTVEGLGR